MNTDFTRWEFKVLSEKHSEVQKILNQWRHEFLLHIIEVNFRQDAMYMDVLLTRRRFDE